MSKNSKTNGKNKKKPNALATAATRKLAQIGAPKMSPEQLAHAMMHAESDGRAERVPLENGDGAWAWRIQGPDGTAQLLKPTAEILAALARFEREGHPAH
jgi:hypothetical protein